MQSFFKHTQVIGYRLMSPHTTRHQAQASLSSYLPLFKITKESKKKTTFIQHIKHLSTCLRSEHKQHDSDDGMREKFRGFMSCLVL